MKIIGLFVLHTRARVVDLFLLVYSSSSALVHKCSKRIINDMSESCSY